MEPILLALKAWGDENIGLYGKPLSAAEGAERRVRTATAAGSAEA
jgi:hypothetical protein